MRRAGSSGRPRPVRGYRRAVDPIVATILMVAVVVVLAAVLYILVTGLDHASGSAPIGSAFAAGHAVSGTCPAGSSQTLGGSAITGGCHPGDFIYTLTIESATAPFSSVLFRVTQPDGSPYGGAGANGSFAVLDSTNHVAAILVTGGTLAMTRTWTGYGPTATAPTYQANTPLSNLFIIVIDLGTAPTTGQELTFVAYGTGTLSGATQPVALP